MKSSVSDGKYLGCKVGKSASFLHDHVPRSMQKVPSNSFPAPHTH